MTDSINIHTNNTSIDSTSAAMQGINGRISKAADSLYNTSKEKYNLKAKLIEEAKDMTTQEKLDALDQNYDRHNQEVWQGILIVGVVTLGFIGLASGNPAIIKSVRRLVA